MDGKHAIENYRKKTIGPIPLNDISDVGMLRFMLNALFGRDCDELAQRLIARFGSFHGIFKATVEELSAVEDMTERSATFFVALRPVFRQALIREVSDLPIDRESALVKFALAYFLGKDKSSDFCLFMDENGIVMRVERMFGESCARDIVGNACRFGAQKVAWIRNEPYGGSQLSSQRRLMDLRETIMAFDRLRIEFIDYIEYSPFGFVAFRRLASGDKRVIEPPYASDEHYGSAFVMRKTALAYLDRTAEYR